MDDHSDRFKYSLLRMLQTGTFQDLIGCKEGQRASVEFRLRRTYHVQLNRRTVVVDERDVETIRRQAKGRWRRISPPTVHRNRIVLERRTGKILESPSLGTIQTAPLASAQRARPRRRGALASAN